MRQALERQVGRATVLDSEAERQLCSHAGTLTTQLARLHDEVGLHLHRLVGTRPDLPPRKPHPWTLLTEHEHPAWPLMALSHPPVLPAGSALQAVRHLATAHLAMEASRCHEWAASSHPRDGYEVLRQKLPHEWKDTWAGLTATILTVQAQHAMLHGWGVLSAYVGLEQGWRHYAAAQILAHLTSQPDLLSSPAELAATTLWATLTLLHGGLPRPADSSIQVVAQALRSLPDRTMTAPLPTPDRLKAQLRRLLPELTEMEFESMAEHLYGKVPASADKTQRHSSGQSLTFAPGRSAYWLRRGGQLQVVTAVQHIPGAALDVRGWHWNL